MRLEATDEVNERARTFHNERLVVIRFETRDATRTMGSIERLIEQVEVHLGLFFLFGFRSRRGGRAAGVAPPPRAAAAAAAAEGTDASLALPSAINSATSLPSISLKKAESLESSTSAAAAFERGASSSRQSRVSRGARSRRVASRASFATYLRRESPSHRPRTGIPSRRVAPASRSERPRQSSSPKP